MLERAAADPLEPGSNPRADVVGSAWLLLLPDLELRRVVISGRVDDATRGAIELVADEILDGEQEPSGDADLVVVGNGGDLAAARRQLRPGGALYTMPGAAGPAAADLELVAGTHPEREPGQGRSVIVPFSPGDPGRASRLHHRVGRVLLRLLGRLGRPVGRLPGPERSGVVLAPSRRARTSANGWLLRTDDDRLDRVPRWLGELGAAAGVDLSEDRWCFLPGGDYWAQKAVFLLHRPGEPNPHLAIKVGRRPEFAARLETERLALEVLVERPDRAFVVPSPVFAGRHRSMAVLAQSAVVGTSLSSAVGSAAGTRALADSSDALLALATGTTGRFVAAGVAAEALAGVADRFAAAYPHRGGLRPALDAAVEAVAASSAPFPIVFHHGDAGVWNLVRTSDGRIGLLDWENAEPGGVPLWDLFYLFQTYGSRIAASESRRYSARTFRRQLLEPSPLEQRLEQEIDRWCAAVTLDPELVAPLFTLCWAHHAAKEASRLPAGPARSRGRYVSLLAATLDRTRRARGGQGAPAG